MNLPFKKNSTEKKPRHHLKHHPALTFLRVVKNGFKNFWRNAWLSIAATAIMTVTITTILLALFSNKILTETIDNLESQVTVSVFIDDAATTDQQVSLKDKLINNQYVQKDSVEYVSKDEAEIDFKAKFTEEGDLLEAFKLLDENPLPAKFQLSLNDIDRFEEIDKTFNTEQYAGVVEGTSVDERSKDVVQNFSSGRDFVTIAAIAVAGVFALISVLVIFNTIRLAIYSRSDEVRTMKLLGASHGYIRGPFLFEACMYGAIAGFVSFIAVVVLVKSFLVNVTSELQVQGVIDIINDDWLVVGTLSILGGVLIGFFSSTIALSRYMRY